jgi:hypothetical protein
MNIKTTVFAILTGCVTVVGLRGEEGQPFKDEKDKASYAVGLNYGSNLKRQEVELDANQFFQGFKDAYSGKPLLTDQEMRDRIKRLFPIPPRQAGGEAEAVGGKK